MFDRDFMRMDQRSKSTFQSYPASYFRGISVWETVQIRSGYSSVFYLLITMEELAFYPAVALTYFFGVLKADRENRVELNDGASMNVFCLFVLAQPLCLVIGRYTGMATYFLTALVSYNFLPWRNIKEPEKEKASKKKKK